VEQRCEGLAEQLIIADVQPAGDAAAVAERVPQNLVSARQRRHAGVRNHQ
jgi:hypothetical protein